MNISNLLEYVINNYNENFNLTTDYYQILKLMVIRDELIMKEYNNYVLKSNNVLLPNTFDELYNYYLLIKKNNPYNQPIHNMYLALMMYYYH